MIINNKFFHNPQIGKVQGGQPVYRQPASVVKDSEFSQILDEKLQQGRQVKFSKHAEMRLKSRNIKLTEDDRAKLDNAVLKAEKKGVKDSLVLMNNMAFVVNVSNRTVITAVDSNELRENVFTNIDGAVIV